MSGSLKLLQQHEEGKQEFVQYGHMMPDCTSNGKRTKSGLRQVPDVWHDGCSQMEMSPTDREGKLAHITDFLIP